MKYHELRIASGNDRLCDGNMPMAMSPEGFLARLSAGKTVHCVYHTGNLEGLVSAWRLEDRYMLTWEECEKGDQFNENTYTRDERWEFESPEEVLSFIEQAGYPATRFTP
ncbi:MAG: hypothetical protein QM811_25765 [Pirellulales bacterium]